MKSNLFFYLSAGFNLGIVSTIIFKLAKSRVPLKEEAPTLVLSGLAAASSVGYFLSNKNIDQYLSDDFIDTKKDTAKRFETLLV